jgi:hypothetical protein
MPTSGPVATNRVNVRRAYAVASSPANAAATTYGLPSSAIAEAAS